MLLTVATSAATGALSRSLSVWLSTRIRWGWAKEWVGQAGRVAQRLFDEPC